MEFDVKRKCRSYLELSIMDSNCRITSDWLDEKDAVLIGSKMFDAASDLMTEEQFKELIVQNYSKEDLFGGMMLQEKIDNLIKQIKEHIAENPPSEFVYVSVDADFWNKIIKHPKIKKIIYQRKYKLLSKKIKRRIAVMRSGR